MLQEPTSAALHGALTSHSALNMEVTRHCLRSSRSLLHSTSSVTFREATLPVFLVPAFARQSRISQFSTSIQRRSKIGSAPLSLPPSVTFTVVPPPVQLPNARISRKKVGSTVEIEGPLGKMSMQIPPYVSIGVDEGSQARTVSISDPEDREQRAMWGVYS